jgi:hypothetical protein
VNVAIETTKNQPVTYGSPSFQRKQPLLPLKAPTIARTVSIASNDSMARNGDCDEIAGTGSGHGASCRWLSDAREIS